MGRKKKGIPGLSFSWKRATGISAAKSKISRKTGIPMTKAGRQRKMGKLAGCCVPLGFFLAAVLLASLAFAHPGGLDKQGGHRDGKTGEYHYHRKPSLGSSPIGRSTPRINTPSRATSRAGAARTTTPNTTRLAPGWVGQADKPTTAESRFGTYPTAPKPQREITYGDPVAKGAWADDGKDFPLVPEDTPLPVPPKPDVDQVVYSQEKNKEFHWAKECPLLRDKEFITMTHAEAKEAKFFGCGVCQPANKLDAHPSKRIPKPVWSPEEEWRKSRD